MIALESPVEVLALDFLSFGMSTIVNNVWTWVAVLTAAVGVWGIRSTSLSPRERWPMKAPLVKQGLSFSPVEKEKETTAVEPEPVLYPSRVEAPLPSPFVYSSEGKTSGKFTCYYNQEEEEEIEEESANGDGVDRNEWADKNLERREKDSWETIMETRIGSQMGFYLYQDLTVLDGNVVRLWDGCGRRQAAATTAARLVSCGVGNW